MIEKEDNDGSTKQLGGYKGLCGYHPLQETVYYHNSLGDKDILHVPTDQSSYKKST